VIERLFSGAAGADPRLEARREVALGLLDLLFSDRAARTSSVNVSNVTGDVTIHIGDKFLGDVRRFICDARSWIGELPENARADTTTALDSIDQEIKSPAPRPNFIREALASVRRIVESAGGGLAASTLQTMINSLTA
jgi:hypothetical protein